LKTRYENPGKEIEEIICGKQESGEINNTTTEKTNSRPRMEQEWNKSCIRSAFQTRKS
jgi:hypothetical protein